MAIGIILFLPIIEYVMLFIRIALGTKNGKKWSNTGMGAQLLQVLDDKYTFFIPEKLKRQPGMVYSEDMEDRANYMAGNLLDCYTESINGYLSEHLFSSIILIGSSEGAILLPLIYERMNNKDEVKALVSMGFGGVSIYESYSVLSLLPDTPPDYKNMYQYFVEKYQPGLTEYWDSYAEFVYGITYRWFNSFKDIRPFDHYKNIDIPILFIQGDFDYSIPPESTIFIQVNLPEKPFEYLYYKWGHQPVKYSDIIGLRNDIAQWIIEKTDL
jgi:pimeloyl-ACP methyl ester carboxylesterase